MFKEGAKFPCGQCGKQFTKQKSIAKHRRAVHEGVKYSCGQCDNEFTSQGSLRQHRRAAHDA